MQAPTTYKKVINDKIWMSTTQPFYDIQNFYEWILNRKCDPGVSAKHTI